MKRTIDVLGSVAALIAFSPLSVLAAAAIWLTDGRPILFSQERIGRDGVPFTMLKFRTMYLDNDDAAHRSQNQLELAGALAPADDDLYKDADDPRITRVGGLFRRFSFDELPQLINVLRGEMSLVGPRPSLDWEVDLYEPQFLARHRVAPGLTGLWQVSGRNLLDMRTMLALDVEYARTRSTKTDLQILARTPAIVLLGRGAT